MDGRQVADRPAFDKAADAAYAGDETAVLYDRMYPARIAGELDQFTSRFQ
ncbi:hypothetical protein ACVJMZ_004485 [Sinorhizobium medicae]